MTIMTLNQLAPHQGGKIVSIRGMGPLRQRMMDMGLVPGAEIQVVREAPLGDPIEYQIKGYHLSLRKREAEHILVDVNVMTLEQIQPPTEVRLIDVYGGRHFIHRLKLMGLKPGKVMKIISNNPFGPIIVQVAESDFRIGPGFARRILVEPLTQEEE